MSWATTDFAGLAAREPNSFVDGPFGSNLKASEYQDEGVPIVRLQNVKPNHFLPKDIKYITAEKAAALKRHDFRSGDLIIAKLGDPCAVACVVPNGFPEGRLVADVVRFRGDETRVDHRYLSYFLNSSAAKKQIDAGTTGTTRKRVNLTKLKELQIPLPPLSEQKRIAAILDAADALRAKRRESVAQLDNLVQSTFLEMFGDPVTNPMGWDVAKSGELFLLPPRIGTTTPATGHGHLVIRVGEVGQSRIAFEKCGRVEISQKDYEKFRLVQGDTVIARAIGSEHQLGKASFFGGFKEPVVIDSHVMRFRPDPSKCNGVWLYSMISSDRGKVLLQSAGGATAVQFNINAKQASSLQIAVPPLDLQHRFADVVESVEKQQIRLHAHLTELDTLFASLQSRAFNGEL